MKKETVKSEVTLADKMTLHKISVITSKPNKSGAMIIYLDGKKISYVNARNLYSNYCVNPELYGRVYVWAVACDEEKTIERIKAAIAKIENVEDDGSNDEPDEEEILAVEVENVDDADDDELADEYWIVAEVENTLLEIEGYVYSFNYAESDKLFDEIFKFFPYAQWFLKKEIPDEDKRNTYNFPSERYGISYKVVDDDDTPPEDDTTPENDTPNDNSDVEGNEEPLDIVTIRRQACAKLEAVKAECNALEKEQDKLISYRRRCKDKAKIAVYDAKLAELDKTIRAKGKEFIKANDYRNEVMKPTAGELETLKKIAEAHRAEKIASGIKYVAKVYVFPHGIEGEGMVCYPKDCKTLEEVKSWINGDDIPVYIGGVYDAGWIVEDFDGRKIADYHTGLEHLTESESTEFDDGSNDEPDEDFLETLDTSIDEDNETDDELIDEPEIEPPYYSTHRYTYYPKDNPYDGGTYGNYGACFNDYSGYSLIDAVKFVLEDFTNRGGEDNYGGANVVRYVGDEETLLLNFLPNSVEVFDDTGIVQPMVDEFFENRKKEERKHRRNRRTYYEPKVNQPEIDDYAVTPEAFEIAIQAEMDNATVEEIVTFEIGKFYEPTTEYSAPDLQLLNIYEGVATFWDDTEEIMTGKITVKNGVQVAEIDCPYFGKMFVSATMKAGDWMQGHCATLLRDYREWHTPNSSIDLEKSAKAEGDNQDNVTTEEKILPPFEVWQSILDKSLAEIKAIMKVPA